MARITNPRQRGNIVKFVMKKYIAHLISSRLGKNEIMV
jgi:hypothetical protein